MTIASFPVGASQGSLKRTTQPPLPVALCVPSARAMSDVAPQCTLPAVPAYAKEEPELYSDLEAYDLCPASPVTSSLLFYHLDYPVHFRTLAPLGPPPCPSCSCPSCSVFPDTLL